MQLNLSREETTAYKHLKEIQNTGARHNINSCPPNTRARCRHRVGVQAALSKMRRADKVVDADGVVLKDRHGVTGVRS